MQIRLAAGQLLDLERISELAPAQVSSLRARLDDRDPPPLTASELDALIHEALGSDSDTTESVLRQLLFVMGLRRQRRLSAGDVLAGLRYGITAADPPWPEEQVARWRALEPELEPLIDHPRLWTIAKALDLSYDFVNLMQDARILTDIRPVFDRDANEIEAAVVSFTLRLRYDSLDGNHSLSIAMNRGDVLALQKHCERALRKARVAAAMMGRTNVRTTISGSDEPGGDEDAPG